MEERFSAAFGPFVSSPALAAEVAYSVEKDFFLNRFSRAALWQSLSASAAEESLLVPSEEPTAGAKARLPYSLFSARLKPYPPETVIETVS